MIPKSAPRTCQILRTARTHRRDTNLTYIERVNLAIDYITPRLSQPLSLTRVAKAAMLSPYHFHRVFQGITGETPADFIKRLRLEKAISLMAFSRRTSLTSIALSCGFTSSSDFSRSFKQRYTVSPRAFDLTAWRETHAQPLQRIAEPHAADSLQQPTPTTSACASASCPPRPSPTSE